MNSLVDEERVEPDAVNQAKRVCNYQAGFDSGVFEIHKISEECEMDRAILEAVVYKDIAEEIHAPLKKSDNV